MPGAPGILVDPVVLGAGAAEAKEASAEEVAVAADDCSPFNWEIVSAAALAVIDSDGACW